MRYPDLAPPKKKEGLTAFPFFACAERLVSPSDRLATERARCRSRRGSAARLTSQEESLTWARPQQNGAAHAQPTDLGHHRHEDFFDDDDTLAPASRASESPMAIACLRLVTFLPDPLLSLPRFISWMASSTFSDAFGPYLDMVKSFQLQAGSSRRHPRRSQGSGAAIPPDAKPQAAICLQAAAHARQASAQSWQWRTLCWAHSSTQGSQTSAQTAQKAWAFSLSARWRTQKVRRWPRSRCPARCIAPGALHLPPFPPFRQSLCEFGIAVPIAHRVGRLVFLLWDC